MKILTFATYPINVPAHGGQIRLSEIHERYKRAAFEVRHFAIYHPQAYHNVPADGFHIPFSEDFLRKIARKPYLQDIAAADTLTGGGDLYGRAIDAISRYDPDILHLEQ